MSDHQESAKPRIEEVLSAIVAATEELAKANDPTIDATQQNAARTQALAKVVGRLAAVVSTGLGATGAVVARLSEAIGLIRQEMGDSPASATGAPEEPTGEVYDGEVDNTGAPEPPAPPQTPVAAASPKANGKAKRSAPPPPVAPSVPGMPAEVAQMMGASSAQNIVSSVNVKS